MSDDRSSRMQQLARDCLNQIYEQPDKTKVEFPGVRGLAMSDLRQFSEITHLYIRGCYTLGSDPEWDATTKLRLGCGVSPQDEWTAESLRQ